MKTIYKLARTELQTLFYSPIAWLIIVVFTFQVAMVFVGSFAGMAQHQTLGYGLDDVTRNVFASSWGGLFPSVQGYLYLYIPLLTMGLMSRELGSGSIKLLYSSPVTNTQIILGKYLSMMIYGLILMAILMIFVVFAAFTVHEFDFPAVLSGMLGLYLLLCAYAAIGLFMSSLTSYQVVAAICTLIMLAVLNYVRGMWQDIAFVRDITYWLSISGRCDEFISGLICSEDLLYFIIVIAMFLSFCFLKIQLGRARYSGLSKMMRYGGVFAVAMLAGYVTSRPVLKVYYDGTYTKANTISEASQDIVKRLDGGMTITTYVNLLDNVYSFSRKGVLSDMAFFEKYVRFKPDIRMKYVFYYDEVDNPKLEQMYPGLSAEEKAKKVVKAANLNLDDYLSPEQIRERVDLSEEGNHFVRILERDNGQTARLRIFTDMQKHPSETEVSATLKRMVMKLPKVGFLKGHGERSITRNKNRDYSYMVAEKMYRKSLLNQGFDVTDVNLKRNPGVLDSLDVLVVAEPLEPFTNEELKTLYRYVESGRNLVIAGKPKTYSHLTPLMEYLGLSFEPGILVQQQIDEYPPHLFLCRATEEAQEISRLWKSLYENTNMGRRPASLVMPGALAIEQKAEKGFRVMPLFQGRDSAAWNELETIDFVNDTARLNPKAGERAGVKTTMVGLEREHAGKQQRIIVLGDADCFSMGELSTTRRGISSANGDLIMSMFDWLSYEELPVDTTRPDPIDNKLNLGMDAGGTLQIVLKWVLPALLLLLGILVLIRRKGK